MYTSMTASTLSVLLAVASANVYAETVGKSATPAARLDALFDTYAQQGSPGFALGVFQGGRLLYEKGYGLASLEHGVAIDPRRTVFDIASASKQFTAASLLLLVEVTFRYSNTNYFLLSLIVERVGGKRLGEFAHERIFVPLGMKDTLYLDDYQRVVPNRATAYEVNPKGGFIVHMSDWMQTGDGALQTTVADLAKWQQNFDEPKIGGPWLAEQMLVRGAIEDGSVLDYASGLFIEEYRGLPTIEHDGGWAGYRSGLLRFPTERLSIAVLCNVGDAEADELAKQVADIYLEGKLSEPKREVRSEPLLQVTDDVPPADVAGTYWSRQGGSVRRIERSDGKLWYVRNARTRYELAAMGNGRFRMLGLPVPVELQLLPSYEPPQTFELVNKNEREKTIFERVPESAREANVLGDFTGTYSSAELDTRWSLAVDDDKLTANRPRADPRVLEPAFKDAFLDGPMLLRFQRDASGRVSSLLVDVAGMRNLLFERSAD